MADNLVKWVGGLEAFDQAFLVRVINLHAPDLGVTKASLPLVNRIFAADCLRQHVQMHGSAEARKAKAVLGKLNAGIVGTSTFIIQNLDDLKVYRRSREMGSGSRLFTLSTKITVGAGIQWNAFKREWVQLETVVSEQAVLTKINIKGSWSVLVKKTLVERAKSDLFNLCGNGNVQLRKKRGEWK